MTTTRRRVTEKSELKASLRIVENWHELVAESSSEHGMIAGRQPEFAVGDRVRHADFPGEVHEVRSIEVWISLESKPDEYEPAGRWCQATGLGHRDVGASLRDMPIRPGMDIVDPEGAHYGYGDIETIASAQYFYAFDNLDEMPENELELVSNEGRQNHQRNHIAEIRRTTAGILWSPGDGETYAEICQMFGEGDVVTSPDGQILYVKRVHKYNPGELVPNY